jgi:hypothetical protein
VRIRFLTKIDPTKLQDLDELNRLFWEWLETDYQRKVHRTLNISPLDFFLKQASQITLFSSPAVLEEYLLLRIPRKVSHDATLSVDSILYETDQRLANTRLEVRYDPDWLENPAKVLLLFRDGTKVGEARQVNFIDNSKVKRKGQGRPVKIDPQNADQSIEKQLSDTPSSSLSFVSLISNDPETVPVTELEGGH